MFRLLLSLLTVAVLTLQLYSQQKFDLINSGEIIKEGLDLHKKGKYKEAIKKYEKVHENDTNYHTALFEKGASLHADSNFAKVLEIADKGLNLNTDLESQFLILKANALDELGKPEEAIAIYNDALKVYSKNYILYFNRAITLERLERYEEAVESYKQAILLNPYHTNSHIKLGLLAASYGHIVEAMLCLNMALLIEADLQRSFEILSILEQISKIEYPVKPGKLAISKEGDDFSDIELILKNKIALNGKYKSQSKLKYPVILQNQAMMEKLKENSRDKGFWHEIYVPIFASIFNNGYYEQYSYLMTSAVNDKDIQAIVKKNESKIKDFKQWAFSMVKNTNMLRTHWENGKKEELLYVYNDQLLLTAIGKMDMVKKVSVGEWHFYNEFGRLGAQGTFNSKGEKTGEWTWYYPNGNKKEVTNFTNGQPDGISKEYYSNGNLSVEQNWKGGKKQGVEKSYFRFGALWGAINYKDDELHGKAEIYYKNGNKQYDLTYNKNKMHGKFKEYHTNGKLSAEMSFDNGDLNGMSLKYYPNGKLKEEVNYVQDKMDGTYKRYFKTGEIEEIGNYKNGIEIGDWKEYYHNGRIYTEISYDENGKKNGSRKEYDIKGLLWTELEYSKGDIVSYKYYNSKGIVTHEDKKKRNILPVKGYYLTGELSIEGAFEGGERTGEWKSYNRNGTLSQISNYKNGQLHGKMIDYYAFGQKYYEADYKNGEIDGYYVQFYRDGKIAHHGWYENGVQVGPWYYYYANGNLEAENFYLKGDIHGVQKSYDERGKLYESMEYYKGEFIALNAYDSTSNLLTKFILENGNGNLQMKYKNGKSRYNGMYKNTVLEGPINLNFFNGDKELAGNYFNGMRHGKWTWYNDSKNISSTGDYDEGNKVGKWQYFYDNGKLHYEGNYEGDRKEGEWTWYYENGKIKYKRFYTYGERDSIDYHYASTGELIMIRNYDRGDLISYTYFGKDGKAIAPILLKEETGEVLAYFQNGQKSIQFTIDKGYFSGNYTVYNPAGKIAEKINYKNGLMEGSTIYYYENGITKSDEKYLAGELDGLCKYYYENGKIKEELSYELGSLYGTCKYYNQAGKLIKERLYYNNQIIDEKVL